MDGRAVRHGTLILASVLAAAPVSGALTERELARAVARPPAGARLPAGLVFRDPRGAPTTLRRATSGLPSVLIFADFTCHHVCGPGLVLTAGALRDAALVAGRDYRLAVIGLDPRDGAGDARRFGERIASFPDVARAMTLLLGDDATVTAAAGALGYGHAYDAANDQFAHGAAAYVFARDGELVAVLPQMGLDPAALRTALTAGTPARDGLVDRVARLCYGFAAAHGRFGRPVLLAMQALSALLLLAAGAALFLRSRRTR